MLVRTDLLCPLSLVILTGVASLAGCGGCDDPLAEGGDAALAGDLGGDGIGPDEMGTDGGGDPEDMGRPVNPQDLGSMLRDVGGGGWDFGLVEGDAGGEGPFVLVGVVPPTGPVEGGTRVRLEGSGLVEDSQVFFGSQRLEAVEVVGGELVGRTPRGTGPGPVTVKVVRPDGEVRALPGGFSYVTALRIDGVRPSKVPVGGGVELELRGAGFRQPAAVSVGGESALRVEVIGDGLLRAVAPPHARGVVDLRVTTAEASATLPGAVRYFQPLRLDDVRPTSGLVAGGEQVTLRGAGFSSRAQVRFGERVVRVIRVEAATNTIEVEAPPAAGAGAVDVVVEDGDSTALLENGYLYREAQGGPALVRVHPEVGSTAGGDEVLLVGHGFDAPGLVVEFGQGAATVVSAAAGYARVRTPAAAAPGAVDVVLRDGQGGELARLVGGFEYQAALKLVSVQPARGPAAGGIEVRLTGQGLSATERVLFGGLPASWREEADETLVAVAPAHAPGAVDVVVERGALRSRLQGAFVYEEALEIWGFTPPRGSVAGGTLVEVRGRGFSGEMTARLGGVAVAPGEVTRLDRHNLILRTPPHVPGAVELEVVAVDAGAVAVAPYRFSYFNPASRFGGGSGGFVDGAINVSVFALGGGPVPGAFVMLGTRPDTEYWGVTDANGQVTLSGPGIRGPQTVTATAPSFSSALVEGIDAENVTLFLTPPPPPPQPGTGGGSPPFAVIRGTVAWPSKYSVPNDPDAYNISVVRTTEPGVGASTYDPGPGSLVIGTVGDYEIVSRVGDLAVVAQCGTWNERTKLFEPRFLGVKRFVFAGDQQELDVDIVCDIPLDRTVPVKLVNPVWGPMGPDNNVVSVYWDFGFEGIFPSPTRGRGLGPVVEVGRQPDDHEALGDMTYTFIGGSYTDLYAPLSQAHLEGVRALSRSGVTLPPLLDVPEPVSPQPNGLVAHQEIRFRLGGPYEPDLIELTLRDEMGLLVWQIFLPGMATSARLPSFPDFGRVTPGSVPTPYPQSSLFLTVRAMRMRGDWSYDHLTYQDLRRERWESVSVNRWALRLR